MIVLLKHLHLKVNGILFKKQLIKIKHYLIAIIKHNLTFFIVEDKRNKCHFV